MVVNDDGNDNDNTTNGDENSIYLGSLVLNVLMSLLYNRNGNANGSRYQ